MFENYLKIAVRNLIRHKIFSLINILGLATGMACTILILLWVLDELSFDSFHKNAENIYLVLRGDGKENSAVTSNMLAPALKEELPEVTNSTCYTQLPESMNFIIQNGNKSFEETAGIADSNFFKVFSFRLLEGNPATALSNPNSIVLTKEIAMKYFGEEDAFGRQLSVTAFGQKRVMEISGIIENIPSNSHIQSQIIISPDWMESIVISIVGANFNFWYNQSWQTYIKLRNQSDVQKLPAKIKECELRNYPNQNPQTLSYSLLPLTKIHLYGNGIQFMRAKAGDIKYVQIFIAIAVIILLIASINYMNLTTALSMRRTKEVGIKKTVGADRKSLMLQFFGESLLLSFIALFFAVILVELFLPEFNHLSEKKLVINYFKTDFICITFLVTILTGLISGCYPALLFSSFQPIQILKGKLSLSLGSLYTRKGLVVFQFTLSIIMIISTIVVLNQLSFIQNSSLGFTKENILCIKMTGEANSNYEILKNELQKSPNILSISRSESMNNSEWGRTGGVNWKGKQKNDENGFWVLNTDHDLASTFKIEMSSGRFFSNQFPTDQTGAFVINEAAAKSMGMGSPLDEEIKVTGKNGKIIGVTKDFHFSSFHNTVEPLIITIPPTNRQNLFYRTLAIRIKAGTLENSVSFIEEIWNENMKDIPFNYYFFDESLNAQYNSEQRMGTIFKYFSFLSILIACVGLFGLASISAEQRTKEIGIRKVLGASNLSITLILSKEFLIWVIVSNIVAWPIAYYFMNKWLEDFAYRIEISWWVFALSGGIALVIALATVSFQAIKAATANPVESLRYE